MTCTNFVTAFLICDQNYGLRFAPWDTEVPTEDELGAMIKAFVVTTSLEEWSVAWYHAWQHAGTSYNVLKKFGAKDVMPFYWHKTQHTAVGSQDQLVQSVEQMVIGHFRAAGSRSKRLRLPAYPRERHNFIDTPTVSRPQLDGVGGRVNDTEKPTAIMAKLCEWFTFPNDWVMVAGAGAGGDVRGCIAAGRNVIAIERDPRQFNLLCGQLRAYNATTERAKMEADAKAARLAKTAGASQGAAADEDPAPQGMCDLCGSKKEGAVFLDCEDCDKVACVECRVKAGKTWHCLVCLDPNGTPDAGTLIVHARSDEEDENTEVVEDEQAIAKAVGEAALLSDKPIKK